MKSVFILMLALYLVEACGASEESPSTVEYNSKVLGRMLLVSSDDLEEEYDSTENFIHLLGSSLLDDNETSPASPNPSQSWADMVEQALSEGNPEAFIQQELPILASLTGLPILRLTAINHDIRALTKPSRLYFESQGIRYTLCDSDGGATLATLYSLCMKDVRTHLLGASPRKKGPFWNDFKIKNISYFSSIIPLLRHTMNRFRTTHLGDKAYDLDGLAGIENLCASKSPVTYDRVYEVWGRWLRQHYNSFPLYWIEKTDPSKGDGRVLHEERTKEGYKTGVCQVDKTLGFLCRTKQYEYRHTKESGVCELEVDNLEAILTAYDVLRHIDQGVKLQGQRFHELQSIEVLPNGNIVKRIEIVKVPGYLPKEEKVGAQRKSNLWRAPQKKNSKRK